MRTLVLFVALFFTTAALAQNGLILEGKFKVDGGSNSGAKIIVEKNGKRVQTKEGTSRFEIELDFQAVYMLTFEKDGFVSKRLRFDTHVPEDRIEYGFEIFEFTVEIFEQYDDVNTVVFNQPVGKIAFSDLIDEFDYDTDYTKSIQAQIDETLDEVEEKKEQIAEQKAAEERAQQELNKQYENLTSSAQKLEDQGKLDEAIQKLKEANDLKEDPQTTKKIQELEQKKEQQEQKQQQEEQFNKILADAEAALAQGDLEGAKKLFEQADGVMGGDSKVQAGLAKVEQAEAKAAKEAEEAAAAAAAAEEEEKKKVAAEELFQEAQDLLAQGKFDEAKAKLAAAGELVEDKRVDSIAKAIADEEDRIKAEQEAAAANQQKHDDLIAQGNQALASGDVAKAQEAFEGAKALIADSPAAAKGMEQVAAKKEELAAAEAAAAAEEAKKQEQVDNLIQEAQAALDAGDFATAKSKLDEAGAVKEDARIADVRKAIEAKEKEAQKALEAEQKAQEAYTKLIADGNAALSSGDLDAAEKAFEDAKAMKADGSEADQGLAAVQSKRDEIAQQEAAAAEAEAKKKEEFEGLISDAQAKLAQGDLDGARSAFTAAGELFEDKRVTQGLKAIADQVAEAQRLAEEEAAAEQEFNNLIAEGDQLKDSGEPAKAIAKYEQALELKDDPSISGKIEELRGLVSAQEAEAAKAEAEAQRQKEYEDAIAKADKAFDSGDLEKAKELYQGAAQLTSDGYPKSKLDEIQKIYDDRAAEEEAKRLAEEEAANQAAEEEAKRLAEEEAAKKAEEEEAARLAAEEEANKAAEEEAKRLAEQEAANKAAEEEAARLAAEEASNKAAQEEANRLAEEEAASKAAEDEAKRLAQEEAARKAAEEEAARLAAEEAAAQKAAEEESQSQEDEMANAYAQLMDEGNKLFQANRLKQASDKFAEAMSYKPGDDAAKAKIIQINKILAEQEEARRKAEEAAKALADKSKQEQEELANIIEQEDDSEPSPSPRTGTVIMSDVKVGEEASLTARLSEDEKFDGMMRRAELQQEEYYKEQEQKRLRDEYPRRKTVETEEVGNSVITWVYINYGEFVTVYKRVEHNWGGKYYFIDGQATNRRYWEHETQ